MKTKPLLLTIIAILALAGTTYIKVNTSEWALYRATDASGLVEFWVDKPYVLYLDTVPPRSFCWWSDSAEDFGLYDYFESGVECKNWTRSLRKLKQP